MEPGLGFTSGHGQSKLNADMNDKPSVRILVLGDVTRSPRIKNHARSFAREGWRVKFSGYRGVESISDDGITYCYLSQPPAFLDVYLPRFIALIFKSIFLAICLFVHLAIHMQEDLLFVQSPPAAPTLSVVYFFALLKQCPTCIDWHNYGYTILETPSGRRSIASRMYKLMELTFASWFLNSNAFVKTRHFTVAKALRADLREQTGIDAVVVYDKPTKDFKPTTIEDAHKLFCRLSHDYPQLRGPEGSTGSTAFTEIVDSSSGTCRWRVDRPALLVSSCSWTPDDDFAIMLEALDSYNATVTSSPNIYFHKLICIVTGRGPLKSHFQATIEKRNWKHVDVLTPWLKWADYPLLLGAADLGVSLHRSTSNLDLPMKASIVDLIGAEVPVLALAYPALSELLPNGQLGYHFSTAEALTDHLTRLLMPKEDFEGVGDAPDLVRCRRNLHELKQFPDMDWHTHWLNTVLPTCEKLLAESQD
ncbi:Chitobiosyldiphosphodolichol beta-mannosyltransferase [Echinococcus granulosus]|uniref:Chitobiosyldiphosphodolichol beta-mannosyltransferase n=1 Tax=Echinococcus granulosus TaxID=6210 RepID=W6UHK5_ECHGR|nr:Chitobiosyldiphosphodolichol beta-mannosyltransferase [Echinococcus granulosus]EUB60980.1 Chitobiosyldiphosphodolichol beta-mannosyltransferase [Echinococcus granulosus]